MAWTDWAGAGAAGMGVGADIYAFLENQRIKKQQQQLTDLFSNPAKLTEYIRGVYTPMSSAQTQAVHRDLGSNWAVMTGGAPGGAMNQYVADAMAKLENDRYGQAANTALSSLRGAAGMTPGRMPMGNTANIMQWLATLSRLRNNGTGATANGVRSPGISPSFLPVSVGRQDGWMGEHDPVMAQPEVELNAGVY